SARDERDRHTRAPPATPQFTAELAQPELLRRIGTLRRRPAEEQPLAVLLCEIEVRRRGAEQLERAPNGERAELVERLGRGHLLAELGQMLQFEYTLPHLFVQPGILDRACDQRRTRREESRFGLGELAGSLGMKADDADRLLRAPEQRHRHERLEPLLLQFRHVVEAWVVECVVPDERRLATFERPPGEALPSLQADPAGKVPIRLRRRVEIETVTVGVEEVDETGMHGAGIREEPHDRVEHLLEVE